MLPLHTLVDSQGSYTTYPPSLSLPKNAPSQENHLATLISLTDSPSGRLFKLLISANLITEKGELLQKRALPLLTSSEQLFFMEGLHKDSYIQNASSHSIFEILKTLTSTQGSFRIQKAVWVGSLIRRLFLFDFSGYLERFFESLGAKAFYEEHRALIEEVKKFIHFEERDRDLRLYVSNRKLCRGVLSSKKELQAFVEEIFLPLNIKPFVKTHVHSGINHFVVVEIKCSSRPYELIFCETLSRESLFSKDSMALSFSTDPEEMQVQSIDGWMGQSLIDVLLCHLNLKDIKSMGSLGWFMLCSAKLKGEVSVLPGVEQELYEIFLKSSKNKYNEECLSWMEKKEGQCGLAHLFFLLNGYISAQNFIPTIDFATLVKEITSKPPKSPLAQLILDAFAKKHIPIKLLTSYLEILFLIAYVQNSSIEGVSMHIMHHELAHPVLRVTLHEEQHYSLHFPLHLEKSIDMLQQFSQEEATWLSYENELISFIAHISPLAITTQPLPSSRKEFANYLRSSQNLAQKLSTLLESLSPLLPVLGMKLHLLSVPSTADQKNGLFFRLVPSLVKVALIDKGIRDVIDLVAKLTRLDEKEPLISALNPTDKKLIELFWLKFLFDHNFFKQTLDLSNFYLEHKIIRDYPKYLKFILYIFDSKAPLKSRLAFTKELTTLFKQLSKFDISRENAEKIYAFALLILDENPTLSYQMIEKGEALGLLPKNAPSRNKFWVRALHKMLEREHPLYIAELGREKFPSLLDCHPSSLNKELQDAIKCYKSGLVEKFLEKKELSNAFALIENSKDESIDKYKIFLDVLHKSLASHLYSESYGIFLNLLKFTKDRQDPEVILVFKELFVNLLENLQFLKAQELFVKAKSKIDLPPKESAALSLTFLSQQYIHQVENVKNLQSIDFSFLTLVLTEAHVKSWSVEDKKKLIQFFNKLLKTNYIFNDPDLTKHFNHFLPQFFTTCIGSEELALPLSQFLFEVVLGHYSWIENQEDAALFFWNAILRESATFQQVTLVRRAQRENLLKVSRDSALIQNSLLSLAERAEDSTNSSFEFLQLFIIYLEQNSLESSKKTFQVFQQVQYQLMRDLKFDEAFECLFFLVQKYPYLLVEKELEFFFEALIKHHQINTIIEFLRKIPYYKSFEELFDFLLLLEANEKFNEIIEVLSLPQFINQNFPLEEVHILFNEVIIFYDLQESPLINWPHLMIVFRKILLKHSADSPSIFPLNLWVSLFELCHVNMPQYALEILQAAENNDIRFKTSIFRASCWIHWLGKISDKLSLEDCLYLLEKSDLTQKIRAASLKNYLFLLNASLSFAKAKKNNNLFYLIFDHSIRDTYDNCAQSIQFFSVNAIGEQLVSADLELSKRAYVSFKKFFKQSNTFPLWEKIFAFSADFVSHKDIEVVEVIALLDQLIQLIGLEAMALSSKNINDYLNILKNLESLLHKTLNPYLSAYAFRLADICIREDLHDKNSLIYIDLIRNYLPHYEKPKSNDLLIGLFEVVKAQKCNAAFQEEFFIKITHLFLEWGQCSPEPDIFLRLNGILWGLLESFGSQKERIYYLSEMVKIYSPWNYMMSETFGTFLISCAHNLPSQYAYLKFEYDKKSLLFLYPENISYASKIKNQIKKSKKNLIELEAIKIIEKAKALFFCKPTFEIEKAIEYLQNSETTLLNYEPRLITYLYSYCLSFMPKDEILKVFFQNIFQKQMPSHKKTVESALFNIYMDFLILHFAYCQATKVQKEQERYTINILTVLKILVKRGVFNDKLKSLLETLKNLLLYTGDLSLIIQNRSTLIELSPTSILLEILNMHGQVVEGSLAFLACSISLIVEKKEMSSVEALAQLEKQEFLIFQVVNYIKATIKMHRFEEREEISSLLKKLEPQLKILRASKNPEFQNHNDFSALALLLEYKEVYKTLSPKAEAYLEELTKPLSLNFT